MKKCTKCLEIKSLDLFPPNKNTRDFKGSQCRECCKEYSLRRKERNAPPTATYSHKPCTTCGVDQPLENYSKQVRTRDGHRPNCKTCEKEVNRLRHLKRKGVEVPNRPQPTESEKALKSIQRLLNKLDESELSQLRSAVE